MADKKKFEQTSEFCFNVFVTVFDKIENTEYFPM